MYDECHSTLYYRKMRTGLIYTMGATMSQMKQMGFEQNLMSAEMIMKHIFGESASLTVTDTYQFDDYSKYVASAFFNEEKKAKRRDEEFPNDCNKAFIMGARFAQANDNGE